MGDDAYREIQEPQSIDYSSQEDEKTGLVSEMEVDDTLSVNDGAYIGAGKTLNLTQP